MKYKIAVVEDQDETREQMCLYLKRYEEEKRCVFDISEFSDGQDILDEFQEIYDIIFMDIDMKFTNGMDTARKIRKLDKNVIIIFITNLSHYAVKGYEVSALSFLLKPVPYTAFKLELDRSIEKIDFERQSFIFINSSEGLIRLKTSDILHIETSKYKLLVHTLDKKTYSVIDTMKNMEKKLIGFDFFRCNSCYLINLAKVSRVIDEYVYIGDYSLKISRPRKKDFMHALTNYIGGKI